MTVDLEFPTTPGSLIRATACDRNVPGLYMLAEPVEADELPSWIHPGAVDEPYRQADLTLLAVHYDAGKKGRDRE